MGLVELDVSAGRGLTLPQGTRAYGAIVIHFDDGRVRNRTHKFITFTLNYWSDIA
jgi:hypothetical protein